jgi:hypothetical protein
MKTISMRPKLNPVVTCPNGELHEYQQVYGGLGGQRCIKCGYTINAMSEEEYFNKLFRPIE